MQITIKQLLNNPELPGLHVEKIGQDDLYSARIDDNYRIIFSICNDQNILSLLYVGPHEDAYRYASKYKVEVNLLTGGLQQVEKAPKRISSDAESRKRFSRLNALSDAQLVAMDVPEEYWQQLREKVYSTNQLIGFKNLFSSETYETLGFILDGTPVDEAIELWESMTASVVPAEVAERTPFFITFSAEELMSVGIPEDNVDKVRRIKTEKELEATPHNSAAALNVPFVLSASCRNLDLHPVNLQFLQSHLAQNSLFIAPPHLCGIALKS